LAYLFDIYILIYLFIILICRSILQHSYLSSSSPSSYNLSRFVIAIAITFIFFGFNGQLVLLHLRAPPTAASMLISPPPPNHPFFLSLETCMRFSINLKRPSWYRFRQWILLLYLYSYVNALDRETRLSSILWLLLLLESRRVPWPMYIHVHSTTCMWSYNIYVGGFCGSTPVQ
jgi:hypothetical protein